MEIFKATLLFLCIVLSYSSIQIMIEWNIKGSEETNWALPIVALLWGLFYYLQ